MARRNMLAALGVAGAAAASLPILSACGVGGKPIKSKVARRISVRLSAGGFGFNSLSSNFARMKLSTDVFAHEVSFTSGTAGLVSFCHAQCVLLSSFQAACVAWLLAAILVRAVNCDQERT